MHPVSISSEMSRLELDIRSPPGGVQQATARRRHLVIVTPEAKTQCRHRNGPCMDTAGGAERQPPRAWAQCAPGSGGQSALGSEGSGTFNLEQEQGQGLVQPSLEEHRLLGLRTMA